MHVVADLGEQYHVPTCLSYTDLRPDLVVYSALTKTAFLVEPTVDNFANAKLRKETKCW